MCAAATHSYENLTNSQSLPLPLKWTLLGRKGLRLLVLR